MSYYHRNIADLDRGALRLFLSYFSKRSETSLGPNMWEQLNIASKSYDVPTSTIRELLKQAWLQSNKKISAAWTDYVSLSQRNTISYDGIFGSEHDAAFTSLVTDGYYVFKNQLPPKLLLRLQDTCTSTSVIPELPGQQQATFTMSRSSAIKSSSCSRFFYPKIILNNFLIKQLASDPSLTSIVSEYLKTRSFSIRTSGWLSVGRCGLSQQQLSSNAQMFHIDLDAFRFLKVFVYLSDVTEFSGPHVYVSGSSRPFSNVEMIHKVLQPSFRIDDISIANMYGSQSICRHLGPAGTVIIEDTSGFHKGTKLALDSHRDILSFIYESGRFNAI